ncbi:MAG: imidazoleglycerol-phosphate dehydratase [Candidatus Omnitrophica bacterium]|nr:imidazoleglycerol-phosphate dehydratase [Candidatus Omnitrophota bacterium]
MNKRTFNYRRASKETVIDVKLNIDGSGEVKINSGIGFLDHMFELFAFWGHFDLELTTIEADLKVDVHHTNEDLGIVLGQVFKKALGDKVGINRLGSMSVPMEDVTASVAVDVSGRGSFKLTIGQLGYEIQPQDGYDIKYAEHFFEAFAKQLGMNLNIKIDHPNRDLHATLEPVFKALGIALDQATQIDPRRKGIPSTKGVID